MKPVDFDGMSHGEVWSKGGIRYLRVRSNLDAALKRRPLDNFCICRRGRISPLAPLSPFNMLHREYAFALSGDEVIVYRLRRPGVVGSRLGEVEFRTTPASLSWDGKALQHGEQKFTPVTNHAEAAEEIAGAG